MKNTEVKRIEQASTTIHIHVPMGTRIERICLRDSGKEGNGS